MSFIGFQSDTLDIVGESFLEVSLIRGQALDEITVTEEREGQYIFVI